MLKNFEIHVFPPLVVVLLGLCAAPGVAAERVCYTTIDGRVQCTYTLPYPAKIAIWCSILGTLGLALGLYIFLSCRRSRKREAIYHVEANQINGPSLGTTFDPRTATLSATYPRTPEITISPAPPGRGTPPRSPHFATARQESLAREIVNGWPKPPQTAPVNKVNPYPFPGYSPAPAQQPHTAFQSGFPRALYTGQAVQKERNKEWV